jgi:hypothetical protein
MRSGTRRRRRGSGAYAAAGVTRAAAAQAIMTSKTIIWNGPMGVFEMGKFESGTKSMMDDVVSSQIPPTLSCTLVAAVCPGWLRLAPLGQLVAFWKLCLVRL